MEIRTIDNFQKQSDGNKLEGIAIRFNSESQVLYENKRYFREVIAPTAISQELVDNSDIKFLVNHDKNKMVARRKNGKGSLDVQVRDDGVYFSFDVPDTTVGKDLREMVERGDIQNCSFAFSTDNKKDCTWDFSNDIPTRTVNTIEGIYDLSAVADPAYQETEISARSMDEMIGEMKREKESAKDDDVKDETTKDDETSGETQIEDSGETKVIDDSANANDDESNETSGKTDERDIKKMESDLLNKIASIRTQINDILDNVENRNISDDEKKTIDAKNEEIRNLQSQLENGNVDERNNEINKNKENNMSFIENVAVAVRAIANNKDLENIEGVAGNSIVLRDVTAHDGNEENIQLEQPIELQEPFQANLLVDKLGIKAVTTTNAVVIPSVSNVEASIEGENTELVGKKLDFKKTKVTPFRVGLSLPFSNYAIKTADINLVSYAIQLAGKAEAQLINKVMFAKEAVNSQKGAFVDVLTADTGTGVASTAVTYDDINQLIAKVETENVPFDGTEAFVVSPKVAADLKSQPKMAGKSAGAAGFILEDGKIDGIPVLVSSDVDGYIGFGVFSNFMIQRVGEADLVVDNLSRSKENITEINFNDEVALQVVRPEAFAAIKLA